jgi:tRNA modification GTPase
LDLTQAEGLADLVAAETEAQQRQAVGAAQGALAKRAEVWRDSLIALRAEIEAQLDFSDEGDVPDALPPAFWTRLAALRDDMAEALETAGAGERVRDGFRIAILGRPNAGKSTLLNALARRDVAIVTDEPGTTRDVLEVPLDLGGYPVVLLDTAGVRAAESAAEREGVRRAEASAAGADLVLWLEDATREAEEVTVPGRAPVWRVRTKADAEGATAAGGLLISAVTGDGLDALSSRLEAFAQGLAGREPALVTRRRQRDALAAAVDALLSGEHLAPEITADLLRAAGEAIGRLTGRIDVEDVLDRLFSEFCIGK